MCLPVCIGTRTLDNPQHKCRKCGKPVSQICVCNTQDPSSENPQHRVHVDCINVDYIHNCRKCGYKTEDYNNIEIHMRKHKTEKKQKQKQEEEDQVDDSVVEKPKTPRPERKRKLLESFEDEDDQLDDSVVDKNYIPTNKDDDISDNDEEIDDDLEDIQCTQCEFKSFWEDEVKKHMKQNHRLAKKTKLDNNSTKKSSKTIENIIDDDLEYKCQYCPHSFDFESDLKNHIKWQHALATKRTKKMCKEKGENQTIDIAKLIEKALPTSNSQTN